MPTLPFPICYSHGILLRDFIRDFKGYPLPPFLFAITNLGFADDHIMYFFSCWFFLKANTLFAGYFKGPFVCIKIYIEFIHR